MRPTTRYAVVSAARTSGGLALPILLSEHSTLARAVRRRDRLAGLYRYLWIEQWTDLASACRPAIQRITGKPSEFIVAPEDLRHDLSNL